jgi:hypothetical protein
MKKSLLNQNIVLVLSILLILFYFETCKKSENPIKYPKGTFPDTVTNISNINSVYDDYNLALFQITSNLPLIFSSNRKSSGGQFDLQQASISFSFDQTTGKFEFEGNITNDAFFSKLINAAETPGNDFGPYRVYSPLDGFEYLLLSSVNIDGNLDMYYLKNQPVYGSNIPVIDGPHPIKILNTNFDDAYICFDQNMDSAYFISNRGGDFDIYMEARPAEKDIASWFNLDYAASTKVDSINSSSDDKCPFVFKNVMVFTSDRPGGLGGFDLYYSLFRNGKWSSPVNFGPGINTSSDEYRPVIGFHPDFTNLYLMFSSNRPGGKGGFDLYFTGVQFPER